MRYLLLLLLSITLSSNAQKYWGNIGLSNVEIFDKLGKPESAIHDWQRDGGIDLMYYLSDGTTYRCELNLDNICIGEVFYDKATNIHTWIDYMNNRFSKIDIRGIGKMGWYDDKNSVNYWVTLDDHMTLAVVEAYKVKPNQ